MALEYPNLCVLRDLVGILDLLTLIYLRTKVSSLTVGLPVEQVGCFLLKNSLTRHGYGDNVIFMSYFSISCVLK